MSTELKTLLIEEIAHEKRPTDGEVYRKVREHQGNSFAEARWWSCLSANKQNELKRLLRRRDFTDAFDALLDIRGLWRDGMRLGMTKFLLDLKCDEASYRFPFMVTDLTHFTGAASRSGQNPTFLDMAFGRRQGRNEKS